MNAQLERHIRHLLITDTANLKCFNASIQTYFVYQIVFSKCHSPMWCLC